MKRVFIYFGLSLLVACSGDKKTIIESEGNDFDGDGISNEMDNCEFISNALQEDIDLDGVGDVCDPDEDGDGITNQLDNCRSIFNVNQADTDGDGIGDACDPT